MRIKYTNNTNHITVKMLSGGFFVGWQRRVSSVQHLQILEGSYKIWLAVDEDAGLVVGFINAVSDGVLSVYIPLLEVLPDYQGRGIGGELLRLMLDTLEGMYMIDLTCDPDKVTLYEKYGMFTWGVPMMKRNYTQIVDSKF
ncbi:MAG: GNAT family N-acetyltransferase [Defluviitaleaceae bacterium]|nr:GNAT family N-acetyltransferase [Defluviitaleaceae bacterium]